MRRKHLVRLLLLVSLLGGVLAGCGDDSDENGSSSETTAAPAAPTGPPIKLMIIVPVGTTSSNWPDAVAGAKGAARALNGRGGIAGRPVEIIHCNEKNDPNEAAACARRAVDEKVVAVISAFSRFAGGNIIPALSQAGIPYVGAIALSKQEYADPISFLIDGSTLGYFAGGALALADNGHKNISAPRLDVDVAKTSLQIVQLGIGAGGANFVGDVLIPPTSTDYAPYAARAVAQKADGIVPVLTEQATVLFMQAAAQAGAKYKVAVAGAVTKEALQSIGPFAVDQFVISSLPPLSAAERFPEMRRFLSEMEAEAKAGNPDAKREALRDTALRAWLTVQLVDKVVAGVQGDITAESFHTALRTAKVDLQLIPPLDFSKEGSIPGFNRVFNSSVYYLKWNGKDVVLHKNEPVSVFDRVAKQSGGS